MASTIWPFATMTAGSNSTQTGLAVTVGQNSQPTYVRAPFASAHVLGVLSSPPGGAPPLPMGTPPTPPMGTPPAPWVTLIEPPAPPDPLRGAASELPHAAQSKRPMGPTEKMAFFTLAHARSRGFLRLIGEGLGFFRLSGVNRGLSTARGAGDTAPRQGVSHAQDRHRSSSTRVRHARPRPVQRAMQRPQVAHAR